MDYDMNTPESLRQLRESRNLTQQQVADKLHLTAQAIRNYEHGRRTMPLGYYELLVLKLDRSSTFRNLVDTKLKLES